MSDLKMPEWFPRVLAMARHEDQKRAAPWWWRFLHWSLVSWRCPCCKEARKDVISAAKELNK